MARSLVCLHACQPSRPFRFVPQICCLQQWEWGSYLVMARSHVCLLGRDDTPATRWQDKEALIKVDLGQPCTHVAISAGLCRSLLRPHGRTQREDPGEPGETTGGPHKRIPREEQRRPREGPTGRPGRETPGGPHGGTGETTGGLHGKPRDIHVSVLQRPRGSAGSAPWDDGPPQIHSRTQLGNSSRRAKAHVQYPPLWPATQRSTHSNSAADTPTNKHTDSHPQPRPQSRIHKHSKT